MTQTNLPTGDKFDAAEEQALEMFSLEFPNEGEGNATIDDFEDESTSDESDDSTEIEADAADEVEETEDAEEAEQEPVVEEEAEDEPAKFDPQNWDGDLNSLPDDLRKVVDPVYKTMERGMHKKFQELADIRREYEQRLLNLERKPTPDSAAAQPEIPPPVPTGNETPEAQQAMWDKRDEWFAAKAVEKQADKLGFAKREQVEQLVMEREQQRRLQLVQSQDGFRPEVATAMSQIAQQHPYYNQMLDTDEGMLVLFHTAKNALEAHELRQQSAKVKQSQAEKADAVIKKKASAAKGAVSRPGSTRKSTPADTFAATFEDAERAALEAFESGR